MSASFRILFVSLLVAAGAASAGQAGEPSTFEQLLPHYEKIRIALLHDGLDGVADAASRIQGLAQELEAKFSEQAAGIGADGTEKLRGLLPAIRDAAAQVQSAGTIAGTREAFGALSKALVQYRQLVPDPAPAVAFCSMAQKVWLQPKGELGNPYYGQSMARCGEFVSQ